MLAATKDRWGVDDIGDLTGAVMLVTGANSGIGYEAARVLAGHGAHVVLACRNPLRGAEAADRIAGASPGSSVEVLVVDVADLPSVRQAAAEVEARHDRLDLLLNNAGVMATPPRVTADGFELQWATNHLGPFALTGLLLDLLLTTSGSRIVTVSSNLHRMGRLDTEHLGTGDLTPARFTLYGTTKLANLLFTYELDRRLRASGAPTIAVAAHPGWARSNLSANGPGMGASGLQRRFSGLGGRLGQSTAAGALPLLYAATADEVAGGDYIGPGGVAEMYGPPAPAASSRASRSADDARILWEASEELTGVRYAFDPAHPH